MDARSILFIEVNRFYVQALEVIDGPPTVIHKGKIVLDANEEAYRRGVQVGMGVAEVKTLLGREGEFTQWEEEPFREAQFRWLDICAIHADAIEPLSQHQALVDLTGHPDPEDVRKCLCADLKKHGLTVTMGLAGCRWIAKLAAVRHDPLAVSDPASFIAPFRIGFMPLPEGFARRLDQLGCRTIGELAHMPLDTLRIHFGKEAIPMRRMAEGTGEARVRAKYPEDSLSGRFRFEGAVEDMAVLDNGLSHLAQSIGSQLAKRELCSPNLEVWLESEDGQVECLSRTFSKPIGSPASLLVSLRLLIGTPKEPVKLIRLRIAKLKKAIRVQRTLESLCATTAKNSASVSALKNVRTAFGDGAIQLASEIVEPRYKQVRKAWRAANGWTWR